MLVFRDFFAAGLRFPLNLVVMGIFKLFKVFLHQMTPTSFLRLNLYMWLAKMCRLKPNAEGFVRVFKCHIHPKTVTVRASDDKGSEAEPQFGIYTFAFKATALIPVMAYRNKCLGDCTLLWFYHKVPLDPNTTSDPLVVKEIDLLGDAAVVDVDDTPELEALFMMLREVSKVFGT